MYCNCWPQSGLHANVQSIVVLNFKTVEPTSFCQSKKIEVEEPHTSPPRLLGPHCACSFRPAADLAITSPNSANSITGTGSSRT